MSEYGDEARGEYGEGDDALEETAAAASANNSIIGKMRSSVSSILPNSLSKWFSPSTNNNNNDTLNGSYGIATKRTRAESESHTPQAKIHPCIGFDDKGELVRRRIQLGEYQNEEDEDDGEDIEDDADESNYSDDIQINAAQSTIQRRRNLNSLAPEFQPPSKRSKMSLDSSMLAVRPLVASTPAGNSQRSSEFGANNYRHMNLYAGMNRKDLGYNFYTTPGSFEQRNVAPDIIDLIPIPMSLGQNDPEAATKCNQHIATEAGRSRRTLNIPPTTASPSASSAPIYNIPNLKRQALNVQRKADDNLKSKQHNNQSYNDIELFADKNEGDIDAGLELEDSALDSQTYNGRVQTKFLNGAGDFDEDLRQRSPPTDSEAEDGDTIADLPGVNTGNSSMIKASTSQRGNSSGLFKMSAGNSRNGSRTSSLGNGLNFYTHLDGRKSLFTGPSSSGRANVGNALNSSTLSLNSLNRRQFNASIYGSTSALSDSRLLNTSSPFYKGNTTYGGAAAYSKLCNTLGSSSRLTPTLIRPTSSLSTLSTSSNSIAAGAGVSGFQGSENGPTISGTAKTILDLINGFTTPLSEAKKMATNLRQANLPQSSAASTSFSKSKRLTDDDINASRAIRLQQVFTPYSRPTVMLHPKKQNTDLQQMPPVKELQVPSMSQLLQMKKLQNSTVRSREITMTKSTAQECRVAGIQSATKLPEIENQQKLFKSAESKQDVVEKVVISSTDNKQQQQGQKHINKIKHKISSSLRVPTTTEDETPPLPADLPNIVFPAMKNIPKIDIVLPSTKSYFPLAVGINKKQNDIPKETSLKVVGDLKSKTDGFTFSAPTDLKITSSLQQPSSVNFTFSQPESLNVNNNSATKTVINHKPIIENAGLPVVQTTPKLTSTSLSSSMPYGNTFSFPKPTTTTPIPTLKTGSVMDILKKPISMSAAETNQNSLEKLSSIAQPPLSTFGNQFKKSSNEWECDACMVRNKSEAIKCISCETPKKSGSGTETAKLQQTSIPLSGFGNQFKKASTEWECDMCMVRNKNEATKCISCDTSRKSTVVDSKSPSLSTLPLTNTISSGFGTQFKKPAGEWECDTCMVRNKSEASKCVSCETPRKGGVTNSTKSIISQPFGNAFNKPAIADTGFKSLAAAQNASTWECEACMTRNNSMCSKCVCCEQAKPGGEAQKTNAPSFSFGTTAASKFSFGFGASNENDLRKNELGSTPKSTTILANTVKTEDGTATTDKTKGGFVINAAVSAASTTASSGFSFGFQPTKSVTTTAGASVVEKDATDKPSGFTFGLGNTLSPKSSTISIGTTSTTNSTTSSSGSKLTFSTTTASSINAITAPSTTTATTSITSFTPPKSTAFSFGSSVSATKATTNNTATSTTLTTSIVKPQEGFSFGFSNQNQSGNKETTNSLNATPSSGFAFSSTAAKPQTTTGATTTATPAITDPLKPVVAGSTFAFKGPSTITSTTSATFTPPKPMFSFGVSPVPITSIATTSLSAATTTKAVTANTGFSFGTTKSSPIGSAISKDTKPLFGLGTTTDSSSITNNTFGSFGTPKTNTLNETNTVPTTAAPTFGAFNFGATATNANSGKIESGNLFGSMIAKTQAQGEPKQASAVKPIFGNPSNTTSASSEASSSSTWPKNAFLFGSGPKATTASDTTTAPPVFGGLKSETATAPVANINPTPIFGTSSTSLSTSAFGNNNTASSAIFGTNPTPALQNTTNLFGGSKDNTVVPQFGSISNNGMPSAVANATPTFGSTMSNVANVSFGGFGAPATASSTTNTEPIAQSTTPFNFETPQTLAPSSGFNFGSNATNTTKPAFNFSSTNQPTFNFTGGSTETTQPTARPFQFGAAAAAPSFNSPSSVFSFGGAPSIENSSNTPFQFNAGAAPPTNNIFAPAPTASSTTPAARRKVRITTRRMTPR